MRPNEGIPHGGVRPRERLEDLEREIDERLAQVESEGIAPAQLQRLLEISRSMNRIHDRDELLSGLGSWLREIFDAENGFVILFDERGEPQIRASVVRSVTGDESPISQTILRQVRESREPVLIDNAAEMPHLRDQSSIKANKIASVLCAPLLVGDKVIGALQFDHRGEPNPFLDSDRRLLSMFADQAATAFNNLQLIENLNEALAEIQRTQTRMVQAERLSAVGEMAAGIAHNFNNTLFVALGFCDLLLARESIDLDVRSALERIRTCALDAASTVRRLQTFARGEAGEQTISTVELASVVQETIEFSRHKWSDEARLRGVTIEVRAELGATPGVRANPADLREVLINLIFNAVDAMESSGAITLSTGAREGRVFATVCDEGVGMDAATLQRVFEPFFTTKGPRGHGFGLSTCWTVAQALGGEISVDSKPGTGSTFTLWLPIAGATLDEPAGDASRVPLTAHLLVIDDDPEVLRTVRELLEVLGHRVSSFSDAQKALEAIEQFEFDCVITDLGMPGLGGSDLARKLVQRRPELPILILTGWGRDAELAQEVADQVVAVLSKPITLDALRGAVAHALGD